MGGGEERGFEPATGDGPPALGEAEARAASVRSAWAGLRQIRRLANNGRADPESAPAPWELHRPVRAVALALEAAGLPASAVGPSGERTAKGYRVTAGASPGTVRVEWLGPAGSGAAYEEDGELPRCAAALREWGWTALLYRGPRGRRFLEVEPPAGRPDDR
ncbi:hypothetical protein ABZ565_15720 [Streptomyces sp. NPDC016469]|uniref:hypothetical protein n=1 Tax=Streptomyces sp. NPDC016469 TaxID=3157191 RepID=UPI00340BBEF5